MQLAIDNSGDGSPNIQWLPFAFGLDPHQECPGVEGIAWFETIPHDPVMLADQSVALEHAAHFRPAGWITKLC